MAHLEAGVQQLTHDADAGAARGARDKDLWWMYEGMMGCKGTVSSVSTCVAGGPTAGGGCLVECAPAAAAVAPAAVQLAAADAQAAA